MIFVPTKEEEKYINVLDSSTHGEFVLIRMTPTMLKKSIIDASHPLRLLLKENLGIDYKTIGKGKQKNGLNGEVELLVNGEFNTRAISYYRPETKKGDPRFCISRLHNEVQPFDMILFTVWNEKLYALPLIGDIGLFATVLKKIFYFDTKTLPLAVLEIQDMIKYLYKRGWVKTLRAGDTCVGY
ncbi:MAG TPA: hypothetical protein ENK75_02445, partial [Saprospiraceae bacterium]|nr:hypothetical protein [Saprospiraceae bacterium]